MSLFTIPVAGAVTLALLDLVVVRVAVDFTTFGFVVALATVDLGTTVFAVAGFVVVALGTVDLVALGFATTGLLISGFSSFDVSGLTAFSGITFSSFFSIIMVCISM
ncbi:hypothetical protein [Flavobacterium sp. M31R6]|uniref:hypothetical protein n=1 Tax=Flavobacterium sp. M31R6 TaxID=2739062 RepID=UPI0015691158|nr:hypothetical protein [Flavobacterium sp. M31R6]QKJ63044.1 hypothetical protein HQN62_07825 [Flavobacterium sp. M31R6]